MHNINRACTTDNLLNLLNKSKDQAVKLINSQGFNFPDLYVNISVIDNVIDYLNDTVKHAVLFIHSVLNQEKTKKNKNLYEHAVFRWIFDTGFSFCIDDDYNEILNITVSSLINTYKDISILPNVANMIFIRYRQSANTHDIVWAYFRTESILCLKILSARILSKDDKEASLVRKLLNIDGENNKQTYYRYIKWIEENEPFIYFTGESYQYSSAPVIYKVDKDCKYICKKHGSVLSIDEKKHVSEFKSLDEQQKDLLSSYSYKLFKTDREYWRSFLGMPIDKQLSESNVKGVLS